MQTFAEGLWISPTGDQFSVVEHIQFIQEHPEIFDLDKEEVDVSGLDTEATVFKMGVIALNLIRRDWVRYRLLDLTHNFEVSSIESAKDRIIKILATVSWPAGELVEITAMSPPMMFKASVEQFLKTASTKRSYPSAAHKRWAFSYRLGKPQ